MKNKTNIRRFGLYPTRAEAKAVLKALRSRGKREKVYIRGKAVYIDLGGEK